MNFNIVPMKQIKAFIRPNMTDEVVDALESLPNSPGLTVSKVEGWGHTKNESHARLTERVKLEIVVPEEEVETVVNCVVKYARTGDGHYGDGIVFVSTIDDAVRIRNGKRGKQILNHYDEQ